MRNTVIACLALCSACLIDREIGELKPGRGGGTVPPVGRAAPPMIAPPPRSSDPCCTVGARLPVDLAEPDHTGVSAYGVWDGARWAVAWQDFESQSTSRIEDFAMWRRAVIRFIDDGVPGALLHLSPLDAHVWGIAHDRSPRDGDRYLVALNWSLSVALGLNREVDHTTRIVAVDSSGVEKAVGVVQHASRGVSMARSAALRAWAVAATEAGQDPYGSGGVILLDEQTLQPLREGIPLGQVIPYYRWPVTVLALDDKVVTLALAADGVHIRTFVGRNMDQPHPEVIIALGNLIEPVIPFSPVLTFAAALVRDQVVMAALNRETLRTWTYRPTTGTVTGGPNLVDTTLSDGTIAMAGETLGGSAAICYGFGARYPGQPAGLRLALVGPDGEPRGKPVELMMPTAPNRPSCDVAAGAQDKYLVTLGGSPLEQTAHTVFAIPVQVMRSGPSMVTFRGGKGGP